MANFSTHRTTSKFGTLPVFITTISTILGAILFLRFGYAVGHQGFLGAIGIILLGHMVTIPTAMAVAEIATNQKVQGGGAYYIISRSFGLNIGSAIGITLYLSQAISVAFYIIAFSEAFDPLIRFLHYEINTPIIDKRWIGIFSMTILAALILTRGANIGMKALYLVVAILFTSLLFFFLGKPTDPEYVMEFNAHIRNPDSFFYVFTIVFPAFTGLVAGLGLSGDLRNPSKSIPRGTLLATGLRFCGLHPGCLQTCSKCISTGAGLRSNDHGENLHMGSYHSHRIGGGFLILCPGINYGGTPDPPGHELR